jgi:hypothetical protein
MCHLEKEVTLFYTDCYSCKECRKEKQRLYYEKNKKSCLKSMGIYAKNNPEKIKANKRKYNNTKKYTLKRYHSDPLFKLAHTCRKRIRDIMRKKSFVRKGHLDQYLGCSVVELRDYLEKQFQPGMTWDNHGAWHIDHIKPLITAKTEVDMYGLCHYTNLQPLWAKDNLSKNDKTF